MRPEFKRAQLKERLLDKNNLPVLEELLNREMQQKRFLRGLKENNALDFDFGPKYSKQELPAILAQVKADVDEFLGTSNVNMPRSGYFTFLSVEGTIPMYYAYRGFEKILQHLPDPNASFPADGFIYLGLAYILYFVVSRSSYNPILRTVTLEKEKRAEIVPTFAHEYAHHVQKKRGFPSITCDHAMTEGHARGVERFIARTFNKKEDDPAFLYGTTKRHVDDLGRMYKWLCKKHGIEPKINISFLSERITDYSIGTTALYIQEALQGNKIFREIIEGKFQFANP
ncbi:hypothetical protein HZA97_08540 [Candidatus Woesearchaeota archaeon]|nr:hypothetical protein [Candidatus Woesearchaeota archaeon]